MPEYFPYFLSRGEAAAKNTWEATTVPPVATRETSGRPDTYWGGGRGTLLLALLNAGYSQLLTKTLGSYSCHHYCWLLHGI